MEKILYIVPHLSTGGMPQYLLKQIEEFKESYVINVIEYNHLSSDYVVQRNNIEKICELITLGTDKTMLLRFIKNFKPDVIHFQEIPETFIENFILDEIFDEDRVYSIVTTTHSSFTKPSEIGYSPDRFVLVSQWSYNIFNSYFTDIECDIWEYPIENKEYDKVKSKLKLNFDPNYKHVLHVGLFTDGKNQEEIFELAKLCETNGVKIKFHFVGNLADNFKYYWETLLFDKPNNCIIHGEKSNVEDYYKASDLFYFPSKWELNPLSVKEALSFGLPVLLKKLDTYMNTYDDKVIYIDEDKNKNFERIISLLKPEFELYRIQFVYISTTPQQKKTKKSRKLINELKSRGFNVKIIENEIYDGELDLSRYRLTENIENVNQGHYGCYLGHTQALREIDTKNFDYTVILEEDCLFDIDKLLPLILKSITCCENDDVRYVSFGSKTLLKTQYNDYFYESWHQDLTHCYLIPNYHKKWYLQKIEELPWDSADLWYNHLFCHDRQKRLSSKEVMATQNDGYSIIDKKIKIWKNDL